MKALKLIRICVAAAMFVLVTLFFLGLGGGFGLLEKIQLVPALLGCALVPLAAWLVITLLFGRLYCSFVCPFGILQDVLGFVLHRRKYAPAPDRPWIRFVLIWVFASLAVLGGAALAGLVDPYSLFGRLASELFQPLAEGVNNLAADKFGTDGALVLFKHEVFVRSVAGFTVAACALALLAGLVAWKGRLFCNTLCPAGAILAGLSKKTVFRLAFDTEKCVKCGLCSNVCKALCLDGRNQTVDNARCVRCFNCVAACPKGALSFTAVRVNRGTDDGAPDTSRRAFAASAGLAGCCAVALAASGKLVIDKRTPSAAALPPPGADPKKFRRLCTGCGLCVAKCPKKVLTPAGFTEYGPLGFMIPKMDFTHGFCSPTCTTCGEVCPTGAIKPLDLVAKKTWKIGLAEFNRKACLVCTEKDKMECGLCARRCPQKAIALNDEEITVNGQKRKAKVPSVDAAKCIGCGACVNYCPGHAFAVKPVNVV